MIQVNTYVIQLGKGKTLNQVIHRKGMDIFECEIITRYINPNKTMKFSHLILLTFAISTFSLKGKETASSDCFQSILGNDLSGWKVPNGNDKAGWYTVKDGVLSLKSGPKKKGSVLWTEKEYTDFVVECEFLFGEGTIDSGIHLRNSDQIQIGISGSLKRDMTASPYIPGKGYPVEAKNVKKLLKAKDWNHLRIEAKGKTYTTWLQGEKVMTYTSDKAIPKGPIGIQLHGNRNMSIDYRNMKVKEL